MKVGIAFSGGGIRGSAHLGIAQALYDNGVKPTIFTGTSSGSIVATLLALGYQPKDAFHLFTQVDDITDIAYGHIIKGLLTKSKIKGVAKGKVLRGILDHIFEGKTFNDLPDGIRLGITTTRISTGTQIIFSDGFYVDSSMIHDSNFEWDFKSYHKLSDIVRASCSIPGFYIPHEVEDVEYVDGGITNNLPSDIAYSMGADKVIVVDLGYSGKKREIGNIFEIISQSSYILMEGVVDEHIKENDLYLNPEIYDVGSLEIEKVNECYIRGYEYAQRNMERILGGLK